MHLSEIKKYLYDNSPDTLEYLAQQAQQLTRQRFGHTIQLYAPLYVSNECVDTCRYCGFSRPNEIERKTLTIEEVSAEVGCLMAEGFRHLLLVAGEHPRAVSPDYLCDIAERLRPKLASLSIEVAPFDVDTYQRLMAAGVDGVVIYQETYDEERYAEVHVAGPKRDYAQRRDTPERAAQGGARRIGMGILIGLADWRKDALELIRHVQSLQKRYWQVDFQVSMPRLRPCAGGLSDTRPISDGDYVRLICALRLALPEVGIVLSTREPAWLRDGLVPLGVTQMSAGSRTEPGGYLQANEAEEQFKISDERSAARVAEMIQSHTLEPVWKDWEGVLHG